MLRIKEIKPLFSQVLVTENLYGWDDKNEAGVITNTKGDIKHYQTVLAVGDDVKFVKPGDTVVINFYKYARFKNDPNSLKAMADNPIVELRLDEVELIDKDGDPIRCFLIDQRDIKYVLTDYEEVAYNSKDELQKIKKPVVNLIMPNKNIRL